MSAPLVRALVKSSTVQDILNVAQNFNKTQNITGFLCYGSRCFFQFIEGTKDAILALYEKLKKDFRHHKVTLISEGHAEQRRFQQWDMYSVIFDEFITNNHNAHAFMPFRPYDWDVARSDDFVTLFDGHYKNILHNPSGQYQDMPIRYNTLGEHLQQLVAKHQVFIFLQVILLLTTGVMAVVTGLFHWRK